MMSQKIKQKKMYFTGYGIYKMLYKCVIYRAIILNILPVSPEKNHVKVKVQNSTENFYLYLQNFSR
jgi:hypothetical protein